MKRSYWHPRTRYGRWVRFVHRGGLALATGGVTIGILLALILAGRFALPATFYTHTSTGDLKRILIPPTYWTLADGSADKQGKGQGATEGPKERFPTGDLHAAPARQPQTGRATKPVPVLGTDQNGRDVFWRIVHGAEYILLWGTLTAMAATIVGLIWGLAISWWTPPLFPGRRTRLGGLRLWIGNMMAAGFELFDQVPRIFLLLLLTTIGGMTLAKFMIATGFVLGLQVTSGIRSHTDDLRRGETVVAAEEMGVRPRRIVWVHIVWHNLTAYLLAQIAYGVGAFVLWDATLGYIGLGVRGFDNWGQIIFEGGVNPGVPWMVWPTLILMMVTMFSLYKVGDGVERWTTS